MKINKKYIRKLIEMAILELKNIPEFVYPDENLKKHNLFTPL